MKNSTLLLLALPALLMTFSVTALAQETCSADDAAALETCLSDAKTICEAQFPDCETFTVSIEDALALLDEKCGACDDARNFGKYNSCLKRTRNGLRGIGALSDDIKAALATARSDCKAAQKEKKGKGKGKKGGEEEEGGAE